MGSFVNDLRYALRSLRRHPAFSLVAAGTLALGIGATTAIFSVVNSVLLRPLPYANSERIVQVWERDRREARDVRAGSMSWVNFLDYRADASAFEALALYRNANVTLAGDDGAEIVPGAEASAEFFDVFDASPILGRAFTTDETRHLGPDVAIIGYGFWQERLGGRSDVVGSTLRLQGTTYEIVGVAPEGFEFPNQARIWLPVQNNDPGCGRGCVLFAGMGLLRPGVSADRARIELETISQRLSTDFPEQNANTVADLAPLHEVVVGDVRLALFVVFGAVIMVLLIACANVANLMLVRGSARNTEMAVRAVLGAGRRRLVAQLVTESAVLAAAGAALGILLATWGVDVLRSQAPDNLPRVAEIGLDAGALAFALAVALATVALFGLVPAVRLSRAPFAQTIREGGRGAVGHRSPARGIILGAEVALSVTLLLGAGLLLRSLVEMRAVQPGFDPDGIARFSISLSDNRYPENEQVVRFVERATAELAAIPGVESVGYGVGDPFGRARIGGGFQRTDRPPPAVGESVEAAYIVADPAYLPTLRIPVVQGRNFLPTDRHGSMPVAMINETFARRFFPGENPIGRQLDISVSVGYPDTLDRTIVGVVGDVRGRSLTQPALAEMYVPQAQSAASFGTFLIRAGAGADQVLGAAREVMAGIDPQVPLVQPGTLRERLSADTAQHTFYLMLIGLFAVLAVTLAAVGMYGVVAFAVAQRTREIGVRMALGARARQVVRLVVWQGLRPALLGALAGTAAALAAGRVIASLLFQVRPQDPLTLLGVAVILLTVVAIACLVPARRATRIPPALALRSE